MGHHTQPQSQSEPQSHPPHQTTAVTTTATAGAGASVPQPLAPAPESSETTTTTTTTAPLTNSTSSKIPFRPRKVRKLSNDASPENHPDVKSNAENGDKIAVVQQQQQQQQVRLAPPRYLAKTLSSHGEIAIALRHLRSADPHLARLIDVHLPPTFDSYLPPFLALSKSILYQQLAYKAGTSIYSRFVSLCGGEAGVVPETILALTPQQLRQIGISARKASYLHDLANKYCNGILSDASILGMDDKSLFTMLTMVKGIGAWSVHMFMIFSLHRPDVLPIGDVGVRKGVQLLYGLEELPRPSQMEQLCEKWRPYRSVASWYMWRFSEAKGGAPAPPGAAVGVGVNHQEQEPQLLDQISGIASLGISKDHPDDQGSFQLEQEVSGFRSQGLRMGTVIEGKEMTMYLSSV